MSEFKYSVSIIAPRKIRDFANRLSCALGHDELPGHTFVNPLSGDGKAPATHYGAHTYADRNFVDIIKAAQSGVLPAIDWTFYGLTAESAARTLSALTIVHAVGAVADTWPQALKNADVHPVESENGAV